MTKKSFTLIELMVVVSITLLMSGMILPNFRLGEKKSLVRNAAYQLAQDIRVTQEMAMSSQAIDGQTFPGGYGICFKENETTYLIFVDKNEDKEYNDGELVEEKSLGEIKIDPQYYNISWISVVEMNIVFVPPNPDVITSIASDNNEYMITLTLEGGGSKNVMINLAGLVYIDD